MSVLSFKRLGGRGAQAMGWLLVAAALPAVAQSSGEGVHAGRGTFYGYDGGGNCSLPMPSHVLTAAMNHTDYQGSQACGAYIEVTNLNTAQTVLVRIDNRCPECAPGDVDLAEPAFAQISPLAAGEIPIRWRYVSGPDAQAAVVFKEGSSAWWSAVQVRNHRNPVASLAYRASGSTGDYTVLSREMYNYFVAPGGMGPGPFDLKITDTLGQVLEVSGVPLDVGPEIPLGAQFPAALPAPGSAWPDQPTASLPATFSTQGNSDWGQGYCLDVTVANPNAVPLNWSVHIPVEGTVYTAWNAQVSQTGAVLSAAGDPWNQTLQAGATAQFGFCANR
ncbi:cellulose binding domain-containing protein [Acidovorax sp. GBBC 3334]|uniref:expansin EXLX1 family cellulose-binding protein n=1 Tax=Acidovorax sp. GBBC 3334 TaxID=2940496 RepID=UPI0023025B3B|nr:expansin EXLX1 family cellulose-binding protein [Acidovorax sp. GBBC 3334]MDA8456828.1 cellulose binding domain-containing protein [Acidovorax sp. GBBC 3334]